MLIRLSGLVVVTAMTLWQGTPASADVPMVAVIIDDLGNDLGAGQRTAALPGKVTCSILPHTPFAGQLASLCAEQGKDVFLHLPMQPESQSANPGPGALMMGQSREEMRALIRDGLDSVPGATGLNSHMGSLLTRHVVYMDWLMTEVSRRQGMIFVDSATSAHSSALRLARSHGVPAARRDLFLDADPSPAAIRAALDRTLALAERDGAAIAIGHPRDETLSLVGAAIVDMQARGIILASVADVIRVRQGRGVETWQQSLSRLHPVSRK